MQVQTKAIVLASLKYGDSGLIVHCFTLESGMKSYMLRGLLKSKKGKLRPAYFQPLTQLELVASHSNKGALNSIKDASVYHSYTSLYSDFVKQSIVFFISEMLFNVVKEEEQNTDLYTFIETSINWVDLHDKVANFHIVFLMNLTRYLGFYPDDAFADATCFNLTDGVFTNESFLGPALVGEHLLLFKQVLGTKFDRAHMLSLNVHSRQAILDVLLKYYELHVVNFRRPKSIEVLKNLFV